MPKALGLIYFFNCSSTLGTFLTYIKNGYEEDIAYLTISYRTSVSTALLKPFPNREIKKITFCNGFFFFFFKHLHNEIQLYITLK